MSKLIWNLLHGIDYGWVKSVRRKNFSVLHDALEQKNELKLHDHPGTFMYPLLLMNGAKVRKKLLEKHIYIPTLWPDVISWCGENEPEQNLPGNVIPLPIDQT